MLAVQEVVTDPVADQSDQALDIARLTGRIGAVLRGIDLSERLTEATVKAIRAALVRHKVIFFRGQTGLDDVRHEEFAAQLGTPLVHPTLQVAAGTRYVLELDSREIGPGLPWHTDMAFLPDGSAISILRSVVVPDVGGDTLWANTAAAYRDLPNPLKALVEGLRAVHTKIRLINGSTAYETEHPVVTVHPESGERCLLLGPSAPIAGHFVRNFVGFSDQDTKRLLAILQDYVTSPENTVRWKWNVGDVALWDNRATQHRVVADTDGQHRHVRRVTLAGSVAVGIDGKPSRLL